MYRKLASAVLVASAISAQYAVAVNLGEMTMLSALNEPLKAEIQLRNAGDLDASQIRIGFASAGEFTEAGFERTAFHGNVEFDVELDGRGNGVIKLRSDRRLNEPFIDLLIEARWPTGRMLRSYTALVDLPVYKDTPPEPVDTGRPAERETARTAVQPPPPAPSRAEPRPAAPGVPDTVVAEESPEPAPRPRQAPRTTYAQSGDYLTQRNDTLWGIARDLARESDVTINQTMIALQEMNPDAFAGGNINRLRAGVVMNMPSEQAIREISTVQANARVADQNRRWQDAQLGGERAAAPARPAPVEREGHLSLTSAGTGLADGDADEAVVSQLQQELHAKSESLEVASLEKQELGKRVDSLQSQVEQLQRLIQLKDAELAALQSELGRTDQISDDEVRQLEAELEEIQAIEDAARAELAEHEPAEPETEAVGEEAAVAEAEPAPEPERPVFVPEEEPVYQPSLLERILANPIYIGGVGLLIIAGVAGFLLRRKSLAERKVLEDNDSFDFDAQSDAEDLVQDGDLYGGATAGADDLDALADAEQDFDTVDEAFAETGQQEAELEEQATTVQTGDAIGEAEIYIAYNQFGQAIDLLKSAIQSAPQDIALKSKLLEVCVAAGNKEEFQSTFMDLQASGEQKSIAEAKELLSTNEEAADWLDDLPQSDATASDSSDELLDNDDELSLELDQELDLDLGDDSDDMGLGELGDSFSSDDSQALEDDLSLDLDSQDSSFAEADDDGSFDLSDELSGDMADLDLAGAEDDLQLDALDQEDLDVSSGQELTLDMGDETEADSVAQADDEGLSLDEFAVESDESDELSLDLSSFDETQLDGKVPESGRADEDVLDFDGLELGLEESPESVDEPSQSAATEELSLDDLSFDSSELEAADTADAEVGHIAQEEDGETLSLSDFDLDFDDLNVDPEPDTETPADVTEPEPLQEDSSADSAVDQTIVRDAVSADEVSVAPQADASRVQIDPVDADRVSSPLENLEEDDLTFLSDADEVSTKLDLAQAYIDMGDIDGAREILLEVVKEGGEEQKSEAASLLDSLE